MPGQGRPGQGVPNLGGGPPGMLPQQFGQPPAMRQPTGPPQFGGPPQRPPMTPNSAAAGPPGFGAGEVSLASSHSDCTARCTCWCYHSLSRTLLNASSSIACMSASFERTIQWHGDVSLDNSAI